MSVTLAFVFSLVGIVCFGFGLVCGIIAVGWSVRLGPKSSAYRKMREMMQQFENINTPKPYQGEVHYEPVDIDPRGAR